jgi:hypothetical protein
MMSQNHSEIRYRPDTALRIACQIAQKPVMIPYSFPGLEASGSGPREFTVPRRNCSIEGSVYWYFNWLHLDAKAGALPKVALAGPNGGLSEATRAETDSRTAAQIEWGTVRNR